MGSESANGLAKLCNYLHRADAEAARQFLSSQGLTEVQVLARDGGYDLMVPAAESTRAEILLLSGPHLGKPNARPSPEGP